MENNKRWNHYRNRWVWLRGKKIKLRHYIAAQAVWMKTLNKPGFEGVDHVKNYKNALNLYGFKGIKIYEDFYFKDVPLPEKRDLAVQLGLYFAPYYAQLHKWFNGKKQWFKGEFIRVKNIFAG